MPERCDVAQELERRYTDGLPRLDPVEDMNISEPAVSSAVRRIEDLEKQLAQNEVFKVSPSAFFGHVHACIVLASADIHTRE